MKNFFLLGLILVFGILRESISQETAIPKLGGVCFSSIRDNESPEQQVLALPSAIEEDVAMASKLSKAIRTYTINSSSYLIPEFCEKYGVDCIVGAWIGPASWQNEAQLEQIVHLANSDNPRIKALIIGNEVLHRGDCTESQLIDYVVETKKKVKIPIAVADTWRAWIDHPNIANQVDVIGVQIYPYWEGHSIEGAAEYTLQRVREVQNQYPDKRVVLTEFGWPTAGGALGQAQASPENAARYFKEAIPILEQNKIEYYYFAIWNENWKTGPEGDVGKHWGLFESNGSLKPEFKDLVPFDARNGSNRPARSITFPLIEDESRNTSLKQMFLSEATDQTAGNIDEVKGSDANSPANIAVKKPYKGIPPMKTPGMQQSDPEPSNKTKQELPLSITNEKAIPLEKPKDNSKSVISSSDASLQSKPKDSNYDSQQSKGKLEDSNQPLKPNELHGVCLSLFRDEETPHLGITPLLSELQSDVSYSLKLARTVRTYSVTDSFAFVPEICKQVGIDCYPGAALGKYPWLNDHELEMLIRVGQSGNPRVKALIVGNEILHRGDFSVEQYIQYIRKVKKQVQIPVATAELLHSWFEHPELAAEVDILGVQIYPYWGGLSVEKAAANTLESVQQLQQKFPGKRVVLTEFGWPTDGGTIGGAVASPENAARYLREVIPLLNQHKLEYMYFAMTDEKWKQRDEGGPGPHWGLLSSDGNVKPEFRELISSEASNGLKRPPRKLNFDK